MLVLHGAVIALALYSRTMQRSDAKPGLVAFNIPAEGAHEPHPQPARPVPVHVAIPPADVPAPVLQIARADLIQIVPDALPIGDATAPELPAAIGGGCDLTPQVQDALRHSDVVLRQLPAIPAARRSIANAIVMWNAGWVVSGAGPAQAALAAIRQTIEQSVAASSADCRNQPQSGPRLMYLPDSAGKTTVLALGSGRWNWQQLIAGTVPPTADTAPVGITPPPSLSVREPGTSAPSQTPALAALLASLIGKRSPAGTPYYP